MQSTTLRQHALLAAAALGAAAISIGRAAAQDVVGQDLIGLPKMAKTVPAGQQPLVPQPPRSLLHRDPPHGDHVLPPSAGDNGLRQPADPEAHDARPPQPGVDTGVFRYFRNEIVAPGSLTTSDRTPEPSVALNRDTVFQTGNWYAALSKDNGETWTGVSPYTFFPAAAAGFCCDQRVIYVRSHDIVVWLLQYSANSAGNVYRFAVARGREALQSNDAAQWWYFDFDAQDFGYTTGSWLDYPDLAHDGTWLHCSANVFGGGSSASRSVRWRMELNDLRDNTRPLTWTYSTEATLLGWNYRFAGGISGAAKMIWACHKDTDEVYVYEIPEASSSWLRATRAVPAWSDATGSCTDPGGRNPCAGAVGRIRGGAGSTTEAVFFWTAAQNGTTRPFPYTRVARFAVADRTLIATHDIWNGSYAYAYATGYSNSLGHIGCVVGVIGGSQWPHTSAFIIDGYDPWPPASTYSMGTSNATISQDRYGDYFDVKLNWSDQRTFLGTGHTQSGGVGFGFSQPRYTWFGRDDYEPVWVGLTVESSGLASGVPVTMNVEDRFGLGNGTTTFTRSFAPRQGYVLTAPASVTVGSTVYRFKNWALQTVPSGTFVEQPAGQLVLTVSDIGNLDDTAICRYGVYTAGRYATFGSGCPGTGGLVPIHDGLGTPDIGSTATWRVRNARASTSGVVYIGTRRAPLPLAFLGMGTCTLDVDIVATVGIATNAAGVGTLNVPIPPSRALISGSVDTQVALVDPGTATPTKVVHSNGLRTTVGGTL